MTDAEIKRALRRVDTVVDFYGWQSLANYYLSIREHSETQRKLCELLAEFIRGGNPIRRLSLEKRRAKAKPKKARPEYVLEDD